MLYYNLLLTNFIPRISSTCIYVGNTYRSLQQLYVIQLYGYAGVYLAAICVGAFYLFLNLKLVFEKLKLYLFMVYKASVLSYYAEGFKICIPSTMKSSTVQRHLDSFFFYSPIEIHFTYHEIYPFKMYSQVVFSIVVS